MLLKNSSTVKFLFFKKIIFNEINKINKIFNTKGNKI